MAKLSLKQAVRKQIDYSSGTAVHAHFPCSKRAFAIDVFDRRNAPEYDIGDRVVIDPDRLPTPGNMVFAVVGKDHDPIFGRYARRAGRTTVAEIKALNSDWEAVLLTDATTDRIIGTMTEHVRPGR